MNPRPCMTSGKSPARPVHAAHLQARTLERPSILLIYTDQQRLDSLGCYGHPHARTPHLDQLAREGARFTRYFVNNPVCMPSRMSMLTGRYCSSLGVGTNGIPFPEGAVPVQQVLRPYGYRTAQIGKLHFQPHARRDHRDPHPDYGFDHFVLSDEPGCYDDAYIRWVQAIAPDQVDKVRTALPPAALEYGRPTYSSVGRETHEPYVFAGDEDLTHSAFVADETCRFLETTRDGRPFFAIAGFYAPHTPVNPPKRFVDMFEPSAMPLPVKGEGEPWTRDLGTLSDADWQRVVAHYLALVAHVDDCVGRILAALESAGRASDTLVVFTSDHGEYLGDHGRIQKGMPGHDCICNVPLLMRHPGRIPAGLQVDALCEGVDLVPTLLDWCGVQTPSFMQGKSLSALLGGHTRTHREDVLVEFFEPHGMHQTMLRTETYKYCLDETGSELLYDMIRDPKEMTPMLLEGGVANPEGKKEGINGDKREEEDKTRLLSVLSDMRRRMLVRTREAAYPSREKTAAY
jgi:arylsulfatase